MRIDCQNFNNTNFGANLNSPKLKLCPNDFFIKIKGYDRNKDWANEIIEATDSAVRLIRRGCDGETVLKNITLYVSQANSKHAGTDISKKFKSGILRTARLDWFGGRDVDIITPFANNRYSIYQDRLDRVSNKPLKIFDKNLGISRPNQIHNIEHGSAEKINYSLDYVFNLFSKSIPQFINGELTSKNMKKLCRTIAEIRWIMAHATPWLRGSDAISNVFMRAMLKAVGIKAGELKENISLDLEAFCRNLDDYKRNFDSFFEESLKVAE